MNIFEESLEEVFGVKVTFDENNMFSCELKKDDDKGALLLCVHRDLEEMSLRVSVATRNLMPESPSSEFLTEFGEKALEPLRGGIGIGVCPGSNNMMLYKVLLLGGQHKGFIMDTIESLIKAAEEWDIKLVDSTQGALVERKNENSDEANPSKFKFINPV